MRKSIRTHIIIAMAICLTDFWVGSGLLGGSLMVVALIVVVRMFVERSHWTRDLVVAGIYLAASLSTLYWISWNWKIAKQHAAPVIAACEAYKSQHGTYPPDLSALTPKFLRTIPRAGYTVISRRFSYHAGDEPTLFFGVMFHGVSFYDLNTHRWWANE